MAAGRDPGGNRGENMKHRRIKNQFDICQCGHNRNAHDRRYAKPAGECDGCMLTDDERQCKCRAFKIARPWTGLPGVQADAVKDGVQGGEL